MIKKTKALDFPINLAKNKLLNGYTSWYYQQNKISENYLTTILNQYLEEKIPIHIFQIDDDYQQAIGDWQMFHHKKFPNGINPIINLCQQHNIEIGIGMTPFIVMKNSILYKNNRKYILRDQQNKLVCAGYNSLWGGFFYALNTELNEVRQYIIDCIQFYVDQGVSFFKLDFLYAASIIPHNNMTRSQLAASILTFIRLKFPTLKLLHCGGTLPSATLGFNYARTSCDTDLQWDNIWHRKLLNKERISTRHALLSNILRFKYDAANSPCDTDVYLLSSKINMSDAQQQTLLLCNQIFTNLNFSSEDLSQLPKAKLQLFKSLFPFKEKKNIRIEYLENNVVHIHFKVENISYFALLNLSEKSITQEIPRGDYYDAFDKTFIVNTKKISLKKHCSKVFLCFDKEEVTLAGGNGHFIPCSEVNNFNYNKSLNEINIIISNQVLQNNLLYINLPMDMMDITINNKKYISRKHGQLNLVSFFYQSIK